MMMLYAVAAAESDLADETDGTNLQAHRYDGVTVYAEQLTEAPERSTREVLAYGRLLQQLWSQHPVLPVRFGTLVSDETELAQLVAERRSVWTERLTAVAGRSEVIVHLPLPGDLPGDEGPGPGEADRAEETDRPAESGADYLRRRAAEVRAHDRETAGLKAVLAPYASELVTLPQVRPGEARLSVLMADELVEPARAAVERWATNWSGATVTGPWPPFSFCQETDA